MSQLEKPQQAIVFATPYLGPRSLHRLKQPNLLLSLQGRSLLQRVVEQLQTYGCHELWVMLGDDAGLVKAFLQDGSRWGCHIHYHYVDGTESLGQCMRRLGVQANRCYCLADASCLTEQLLPLAVPSCKLGHIACWHKDGEACWSGWGIFDGAWLLTQAHRNQLQASILADSQLYQYWQSEPLQVYQLADVLASSLRLLKTQSEPVLQGRACQIHPTASLIAPVYLGDYVKIGPHAVVGPLVTIESGSVIEHHTQIRQSLVCVDSYVGHNLEIQNSMVQGALLANISLDSVSEVVDVHLLAALTEDRAMTERLTWLKAQSLRTLLWPLYVAVRQHLPSPASTTMQAAMPRRVLSEPTVTELAIDLPDGVPNTGDYLLRYFCYTFYPGLYEIARGKVSLTGPQLRPWHEVLQLPQLWRQLYGEYRCGLLNESLLLPKFADVDTQFAHDAFAAANQYNPKFQLQLLRRYLQQVLSQLADNRQAVSIRHAV